MEAINTPSGEKNFFWYVDLIELSKEERRSIEETLLNEVEQN